MEDLVGNSLGYGAWACTQETAEVPQSFEEFVPADVELPRSEKLPDHLILAKVDGALQDEPEQGDGDGDFAAQKVLQAKGDFNGSFNSEGDFNQVEGDLNLRALLQCCELQEGLQSEVLQLQTLLKKLMQSAVTKATMNGFFKPS